MHSTSTSGTQECGSGKKNKKGVVQFFKTNTSIQPNNDDELDSFDAVSEPVQGESYPSITGTNVNSGVNDDPIGSDADINSGVNDHSGDVDVKSGVGSPPPELESNFNPDGYWANATKSYVLNTITSFTDFEASKSTPQYGFNRGMKEFGELGFEATMRELDDNLIGMGAVHMLDPSEVNKEVWMSALSYLMFLKRKRRRQGQRLC
jgi:hypothetical protein